jgi:hypothetical protein
VLERTQAATCSGTQCCADLATLLLLCVNGLVLHANTTVEAAKKFAAEAEEAARKTATAEAALAASKAVQGAALATGAFGTFWCNSIIANADATAADTAAST